MKNFSYLCLLLLLAISFFQCKEPDEKPPLSELEYGKYLQTFHEAALRRNAAFDFEDDLRKVKFLEVEGPAEAANCATDHVVLIPSEYKLIYGETYLEQFIYHQLAHCVGIRPEHEDARLNNGEWRSLMRSDPMFGHLGEAIDFNGAKRDYYLDEIFLPGLNHNNYFEAEIIPFDTTLSRELALSYTCPQYADIDEYDTSSGFDIEIKAQGANTSTEWNITLSAEDHRINLTYSPSQRKMFLKSPDKNGFERIMSHYFEYDLPTNGSTLTIRRLDGRLLFYLDGRYMFHQEGIDVKWKSVMTVSAGSCYEVSFYRLG